MKDALAGTDSDFYCLKERKFAYGRYFSLRITNFRDQLLPPTGNAQRGQQSKRVLNIINQYMRNINNDLDEIKA